MDITKSIVLPEPLAELQVSGAERDLALLLEGTLVTRKEGEA